MVAARASSGASVVGLGPPAYPVAAAQAEQPSVARGPPSPPTAHPLLSAGAAPRTPPPPSTDPVLHLPPARAAPPPPPLGVDRDAPPTPVTAWQAPARHKPLPGTKGVWMGAAAGCKLIILLFLLLQAVFSVLGCKFQTTVEWV